MRVEQWLGEDNVLGIDIWQKKYRHGEETFDAWLDRIAKDDIALRSLIMEKKFLFGGRILANRGLADKGKKITYSNCYVIEAPEDNIESIFNCGSKLARTYSYGGGCGIDISKLRPNGSKVNNAAESTSGATSFMEFFSMVTQVIGQAGRRGALMISIDCMHPDIEEFIMIKSDLDKVTKANLSIRVTNEFMQAVDLNTEVVLRFEVKDTGQVIERKVWATDIFDKFVEMNYDMAEPALLYWDRIKQWNLLANTPDFEFAGVNPCAEEPLPAFGSCLLGSINLAEFVFNPFTNNATFDEVGFSRAVEIGVKALNDVLDEGLPLHPLKEQRESVSKWRQIGLGVFGIADMLIKLGITYGSKESIEMCELVAKLMAQTAIEKSQYLGSVYGAYDGFVESVYDTDYYKFVMGGENHYPLPMRNSQLLTIAPTGTLSTMLGVSGGIEPIFANSYTRRTQSLHGEDRTYKVYTPIVEKYIKSDMVIDIDNDGELILPEYFVTSGDIAFQSRIEMQAVWQKYIDASISSTINLPINATKKDIENIYMQAWRYGLKGITVYRAGCKREGILVETPKEEPKETMDIAGVPATLCDACNSCGLQRGDIINVSDELISYKRTIVNGCGKFYLHLDFDDVGGEPLETFIDIGSGGGCERNLQFISRLISLLLRAGVDISEIIDQSFSIRPCKAYTDRTKSKGDTAKGTSCPSAIGWALKDLNDKIQTNYTMSDDLYYGAYEEMPAEETPTEWEDDEPQVEHKVAKPVHKALCPECAEELIFESGCNVCKNCGWSKCD